MTPGDHSKRRYWTYSSGGDTVLEQLPLYDSTSTLKAPCAERWASAPVRTCSHATAPLTVPTPPTLRRLSSLCYTTRSEATSYCAYSGRRQGSYGRHTQACSASRNFLALRVITPPNQPSPRRTHTPRFTSDI